MQDRKCLDEKRREDLVLRIRALQVAGFERARKSTKRIENCAIQECVGYPRELISCLEDLADYDRLQVVDSILFSSYSSEVYQSSQKVMRAACYALLQIETGNTTWMTHDPENEQCRLETLLGISLLNDIRELRGRDEEGIWRLYMSRRQKSERV